jgi:hypothetical protein
MPEIMPCYPRERLLSLTEAYQYLAERVVIIELLMLK